MNKPTTLLDLLILVKQAYNNDRATTTGIKFKKQHGLCLVIKTLKARGYITEFQMYFLFDYLESKGIPQEEYHWPYWESKGRNMWLTSQIKKQRNGKNKI